jgi:hypothetical protein
MNIADNINKQPVGRATMVVNDKCGDPTNYLYKINSLAYHSPEIVKAIAISILTFDQLNPVSKEDVRKLVDKHYNQRNQ